MLVRAVHTALLLFLLAVNASGNSAPPKMRRVCLDRINSTATLYWTPSSDTCSTFLLYRIWGRDDVNGSFVSMGTETQKSKVRATITIPNLKRWQFYIVATYACRGGDSLVSDTMFVDDTEPVPMDIDSVSVDFTSQQIIAGWQKNASPDLEGYLLYKVGASNQIIADTNSTSYKFKSLNANVNGNRIAISAYDSCAQAGLISAYHEPMVLTAIDSNFCKNSFTLRFSPYVGWTVDSYIVMLSKNGTGVFNSYKVINASGPFVFTVSLPEKNKVYTCFIRAISTKGVSSSSNKIQIKNDSLPSHTINYIKRVTQNNQSIVVTGIYDNPQGNIRKSTLEFTENGSTWNTLIQSTKSPVIGSLINEPLKIRQFRLTLQDQCGNTIYNSNISNNILLQKSSNNDFLYSWNNYNEWGAGVKEYQIIIGAYNQNVSTWNTYKTFSSNPGTWQLPPSYPKELCFCVLAIENGPNKYNLTDSSYSNILCPYALSDVYIPNAFTPNEDGKNEKFTAISLALDLENSTIKVFNRWGTKVHQDKLAIGWNGNDSRDKPCPPGTYIYIIDAVSKNGDRKQIQGTVVLIY